MILIICRKRRLKALVKQYESNDSLNNFNLKNLKMKKKLQAFTDTYKRY